ncbi:UNVERIFIED_CONTAM: hypothetical protein K2H54_032581 [Gekko kuhli]
MKFLAITLALAIFAGSPASVCSEEPASRLHVIKENIEEYFRNMSRPFEEHGEMVRNLEVVQAVRDQATESFGNISRRFLKLGGDIPKEVLQTVDLAIGIPGGMGEQLFYAIQDFSRKLEPATRDLMSALEPVVAPRAEQALEKARPYTTMLRTGVEEMGQRNTERLKASLPELEALGPQIKAALGYVREVQVALQPLADELQEALKQRAEGAASIARPYVKPVLDAAEKYAGEFKFNPFFDIKQEQ